MDAAWTSLLISSTPPDFSCSPTPLLTSSTAAVPKMFDEVNCALVSEVSALACRPSRITVIRCLLYPVVCRDLTCPML
ncbi:Uncharacterised protein [Mycobacteroides abscessus subsp. abscessus]|nr:Uncharacterised protein [Mycobacteroides abscessus subsp. abscessus]